MTLTAQCHGLRRARCHASAGRRPAPAGKPFSGGNGARDGRRRSRLAAAAGRLQTASLDVDDLCGTAPFADPVNNKNSHAGDDERATHTDGDADNERLVVGLRR